MPPYSRLPIPYWMLILALSLSSSVSANNSSNVTTAASENLNLTTTTPCNSTLNETDGCASTNGENTTLTTIVVTTTTGPTANETNSTMAETNVAILATNVTMTTMLPSTTALSSTTASPTTITPETKETTESTSTTEPTPLPTTKASTPKSTTSTITGPSQTVSQYSTTNEISTLSANPTIAEYIETKWNEVVSEANFSDTLLNATNRTIIDTIIDCYQSMNDTQLENILGPNKVGEVAKTILDQKSVLLELEIRNQFNASQNASLHAFYASLYWLRDDILVQNGSRFSQLLYAYDQPESDVTEEGLVRFILANATRKELLEGLCKVVEEEGLDEGACPTAEPPDTTAPLSGTDRLESTWQGIVTANYSFLTSAQNEQLQAITPGNLTTGLITFVGDLDNDEIKQVVASNATKYISTILRSNGDASETLGQEAFRAFAGNDDKQDVFYLYLNFINNLLSASTEFEAIVKGFVGSSSNRTRRATTACDTSTINAKGLCCYIINEKASNLTALRDAICEELNGGEDCLNTFTINDTENPTSQPVPPDEGLSTGAIIGIVLGSVVAVVLLVILIFCLCTRFNKKKSKVNPENEDARSENGGMEMSSNGGS